MDGGIGRDTIHAVWDAGADTFVAGNAIFCGERSEGGDRRASRAVRGDGMTARKQWTIVGAIVVVLAVGLGGRVALHAATSCSR